MIILINKQIVKLFAIVVICVSFCVGQSWNEWKQIKFGCVTQNQSFIPTSAHFFNENSGWIVGETGEIKSKAVRMFFRGERGNCTVTQAELPSAYDDVFFANDREGWIVGSEVSTNGSVKAVFLQTIDGGQIWKNIKTSFLEEQGYLESDFDLFYVFQNNPGLILGKVKDKEDNLKGVILQMNMKTLELNINYLAENDLFFEDVKFDADGKNGWITTNGGFILHTNNGGTSWEKQETGIVDSLSKLAVLNSQEVWATSQSSVIIHTKDGGKSWKTVSIEPKEHNSKKYALWYSGIIFDDLGNGWISGSGGLIMKTTNFGETWTVQSNGKADFLHEIISTGDGFIALGKPFSLVLKKVSKNY